MITMILFVFDAFIMSISSPSSLRKPNHSDIKT